MLEQINLKKLIIPLVIEQTLAVIVGMADVFMVSAAGEAAMSGVSLVNTINLLMITAFGALTTGGSVVVSQYIGQKNYKSACQGANQLLLMITVISTSFMAISLIGNQAILKLFYPKVNAEIMKNAVTYFYITAISFPFLGIYSGCTAIFRAMGNSKLSMWTSLVMNVVNITGNAIFTYVMHMGVAGVALATLISRIIAALIMLYYVRQQSNPVHIDPYFRFGFHPRMIRNILHIGVPSGLESAMFQFGKVLVQSFVSGLATAQIAANSLAMTLVEIEVIPGHAIGLALLTIAGQCIGAKDYDAMKYYVKKLLKLAYICIGAICLVMVFICPFVVHLFGLKEQTSQIACHIIWYHSVGAVIIWPLSFILPNALRAAGDVRYPMVISIISMWICRVIMSYVFIEILKVGALGVWMAMSMDWVVRGVLFWVRFKTEKWKLTTRVT